MARSSSARGKSPHPPTSTKVKPNQNTSYKSDGVQDNDVFLLPLSDYLVGLALTLLGAVVRIFRIYQPSSVVFDEVHFGGFASKYIKGRFFMDVHPPLAKMLIALTGWLAGFDGNFLFPQIGADYNSDVPYVSMRLFPAICGIFLVPCMFLTLKAVGCRTMTAAMGASLIIFENGLLTQSRLILLDSPLVAATAFTALAFSCFTNQHELGPAKAFQPVWWFWLAATGLGLGITASIKWVGLFTIAWVGALTVLQLWVLLGDNKNVTMRLWAKHLMARVFCLIVIPLTFYMAMFAIHFVCLVNPGDGDGFMSSEFQATLNSKGMQDVAADVVFGSRVTIRHVNTQGGYLHSHPLMYPTGSKQQQITLYPHKDSNNMWLLENQTQPLDMEGNPINGSAAWDNLSGGPQFIQDGAILRLFHQATHRRLHSHDVRAPVTEVDWQQEVSAYGYEDFEGDANDLFRLEIVKQKSLTSVAKERLRTIETKFRLVHVMTSCVLFSHKVKLPDWASEQQEVTCARGGSMPNSLWYVEHNEHPQFTESTEKVNYRKPGFFGKFFELHKVMWTTNAGLTESHAWDSRPQAWPILRRGINFWAQNHTQIYLIGNPVIWWSSSIAISIWVIFKIVAILRWQRSCNDYANPVFKRFDYELGTSILGWALHYFPFFLMARQLFLHHYFPALYFAIMTLCQLFDFLTVRVPGIRAKDNAIVNKAATMLFLVMSIAAFSLYSPLAYGNSWTKAECKRVKLFNKWDWDCNNFFDRYEEYTSRSIEESSSLAAISDIPKSDNAAPPAQESQKLADINEAGISAKPAPPAHKLVAHEEKVEYRDQDGNLLSEEQVKELEGKVKFETKYETRTRVIDEQGAEVPPPEGGWPADMAGVAPPHPDVQGVNQETVKDKQADPPKDAAASRDGEKEAELYKAKPASEGQDATVRDEL
ncbi:hypothetical protein E4U55_002710 [Claviceps digitariae]|nr:hypothetical protein E4U55_002710 [Claviceps digitariae]